MPGFHPGMSCERCWVGASQDGYHFLQKLRGNGCSFEILLTPSVPSPLEAQATDFSVSLLGFTFRVL